MDGMREFLEAVRSHGLVTGRLRGLFHIVIGRKLTSADGAFISNGITWRDLSVLLKDLRFDKNLAIEVGADPNELSPRDRQRFWYSVIALAQVNGTQAMQQAEQIISKLGPLGYTVGPAPAGAGDTGFKQDLSKKRKK